MHFLTVMIFKSLLTLFLFSAYSEALCITKIKSQKISADVCVYNATPSGILAAIAVKREGRSVVIVEPSRWVGGILGAGLKPSQDCPNPAAVGGMTSTLLRTLGTGRTTPDHSFDELNRLAIEGVINPRGIRDDFLNLLRDNNIDIIYEHRITRCEKKGQRILKAVFDLAPYDEYGCPPATAKTPENLIVSASVFIDAGYEGELMSRAGVSYRTGRESADEFDEASAGVREPVVSIPISPFVKPDNPGSGLLPNVEEDHGKPAGAADQYTQAYNYRYYVTADIRHRVRISPPANYDPKQYELLGRYIIYLTENTEEEKILYEHLRHIFPGWLNSGDYNYFRDLLFSITPVGISHYYADGHYAAKARIWKQHQIYLRGLHHFLSTDPRVPAKFREETASLGFVRPHHPDTHGWPHQLYIRVSRRLKGRYTVTSHDVYNRTQVDDAIGLAQYGIDTYPSRRVWQYRDGRVYVALEGSMFVGGAKGPTNTPYPIPYRAITPRKKECTNLLVPVCFSATHLGYASARMEPVFMICGESSGVAAVQSIKAKSAVQDIDMQVLKDSLVSFNQKLAWP